MPGKCSFRASWLWNDSYRQWIERAKTPGEVHCKICRKNFDVSNIVEAAVKSHMSSKKHLAGMKNMSMSLSLFTTTNIRSDTDDSVEAPTSSSISASGTSTGLNIPVSVKNISRNDMLHAEIMWTLKCMTSHYSYHSCEKINNLFMKMFPDSQIAKQFTCGETKCRYLACFGISPYCKGLLSEIVRGADHYVLLFDESHNKSTQTNQMDIHVRFWDNTENCVTTRYYGSQFLGHGAAEDLLKALTGCIKEVDPDITKILQLSMDGPNVNWKVFDHFCAEIHKDNEAAPDLINIGSCGLHVVHNSFRSGAESAAINVGDVLSSLYWVFNDTPARREDFFNITGVQKFPLKFCKHRWVENVTVIQRAREIWPAVLKYLKTIRENPKKYREPTSKSYGVIKSAGKNPLMLANMAFFESVAKQLSPFLTLFQCDRPMLPFLCDELEKVLRAVLKRFIKPDVLKVSVVKLLKIKLTDKQNHLDYTKVDVGFETEHMLKEVKISKKASDLQLLEFRVKSVDCLKNTAAKLMAKTPLVYSMARKLNCLNPKMLLNNKTDCVENFKMVLAKLVSYKRLMQGDCDELVWKFDSFIDTLDREAFTKFDMYKDRVDILLHQQMVKSGLPSDSLWNTLKMLLILSHGQASVERGFSVNKQIMVENLKEESFVAQRRIHDYLTAAGGLDQVVVTQKLLVSASSARWKFHLFLEEEKQKEAKNAESRKRAVITDKLEEVKNKKRKLKNDAILLLKSADSFAEKAETTSHMEFLKTSNQKRRDAKEKNVQAKELEQEIKKLKEQVKQV